MVAVAPQLWSEWGFRAFVIISLGANVALSLLSGTRRRSASGWWAKGRMVVVFFLWALYQVAEKATTAAISKLTLSDSDVSEDEKQLVALWAAFLLLHLGGPDNLTAYALEDNKLSTRTWLEIIGNVSGVIYAIYKNIYGSGHSRVLFAASVIISVAGTTRYIERAYARGKANLDKMQEDATSSSPGSSKKKTKEYYGCRSTEDKMDQLRYRMERKLQCRLCDRDALLLAQDLFPVWRHAMVDSSVIPGSKSQQAGENILWLKWSSMCKVAEMELSLMYEVLYTKAVVAHSCPGWHYLIRFLSPLFTAAATLLFWLHRQQQQGRIRGSFVGITYALLLINFLLDLAWLLRALGSTWAYAYVQTQAPAWLRHQVICSGRLHRFVIRVDPMRWLLRRDPINYRTWSGTIGRYNLLREATTTICCPDWLVPKEMRYLSKLPPDIKGLLFQRVQTILRQAIRKNPEDTDYSKKFYVMDDVRAKWGQKAFDLRNQGRLFPKLDIHHKEAPKFGKEFEEDVLAWHIATCIILPYLRKLHGVPAGAEAHAKAIAVMSEYMMFLVAVHRDMLPGLVLHSLYEVTHETLVGIWNGGKGAKKYLSPKVNKAAANNEEKLAAILRGMSRDHKEGADEFKGTEGTELLWDAVALFRSLMQAGDTEEDRKIRKRLIDEPKRARRRTPVPVKKLMELIFNVWVDKLVYAAIQCSRESHAKQLSAGGDLTTVLWMVIQHAGLFRMGELKPIYLQDYRPPGEKKKKEEEKKKKEEEKKDEKKPQAQLPHGDQPALAYPPPLAYYVPSDYYVPPDWPQPPPDWAQPQGQLPHGAQPAPDWAQQPPPTMDPTSPPPDEDEDSDDEDTKEYNTPIEYATLY